MAGTLRQLLTPNDVADLCGLSVKTIYRAIHRGELSAYKVGGSRYRIRPDELDAWVDAARVSPGGAHSAGTTRAPSAAATGHGDDATLDRIEAQAA